MPEARLNGRQFGKTARWALETVVRALAAPVEIRCVDDAAARALRAALYRARKRVSGADRLSIFLQHDIITIRKTPDRVVSMIGGDE